MNSGKFASTLLAALILPAQALAQTEWPDVMQHLQPGLSLSPVSASWPADVSIEPPGPHIPSEKARWSGKWSGWACLGYACDTKLGVERVTEQGASIVYSIASGRLHPLVRRLQAQFVDGELRAVLPNGARIAYRIRADGHLEFLYRGDSDRWLVGVLSREDSIPGAANAGVAPLAGSPRASAAPTPRSAISKPDEVATAEAPEIKVGDSWIYVSTNLWKKTRGRQFRRDVLSIGEREIRMKQGGLDGRGARMMIYTSQLNFVEEDPGTPRHRKFSTFYPMYSFPLQVGKTWEHETKFTLASSASIWEFNYGATVLGIEKVAVPAGTFEAFKIELKGRYRWTDGANMWGGWQSETCWYAREVKAAVKCEYTDFWGIERRRWDGYELVRYAVH